MNAPLWTLLFCGLRTGEIGKIKCPTLAVGSRLDRVLSGDGTEDIASRLGCRMLLYPGYGHAVYDEAPDYKQILLSFLEQE